MVKIKIFTIKHHCGFYSFQIFHNSVYGYANRLSMKQVSVATCLRYGWKYFKGFVVNLVLLHVVEEFL